MPDTPVIHIGENSPEQVAFKLLEAIAKVEMKSISMAKDLAPGWTKADRKWILETYAECLDAVRVREPISATYS